MVSGFLVLLFRQRQIGFYYRFLERLYFRVAGGEVEELYKTSVRGVLMG